MCFVPSPPTIYVGLDTGHIGVYSTSPDYGDYTPLINLSTHTARVCKLAYASRQSLILSISRDKHLCVIDHATKRQRSSTAVGHPGLAVAQGGLASLVWDEDEDRAFVGTAANQIYIYHLPPQQQTPVLLHVLQGHTATVRALYLNSVDHYLFSGSYDFRVGIWSIHEGTTASEVGRSRLNGMMSQGPQKAIKAVVYARALREVITGVEGGWLCVWNTVTGKLAYVWKGHTHSVSQLLWVDATRTLISVSLDGKVKFWAFKDAKKEGAAGAGPTLGVGEGVGVEEGKEGREGKEAEEEGPVSPLSSPLALSSYSPPAPHSPAAEYAPDPSPTTEMSPQPVSEDMFPASPVTQSAVTSALDEHVSPEPDLF